MQRAVCQRRRNRATPIFAGKRLQALLTSLSIRVVSCGKSSRRTSRHSVTQLIKNSSTRSDRPLGTIAHVGDQTLVLPRPRPANVSAPSGSADSRPAMARQPMRFSSWGSWNPPTTADGRASSDLGGQRPAGTVNVRSPSPVKVSTKVSPERRRADPAGRVGRTTVRVQRFG